LGAPKQVAGMEKMISEFSVDARVTRKRKVYEDVFIAKGPE